MRATDERAWLACLACGARIERLVKDAAIVVTVRITRDCSACGGWAEGQRFRPGSLSRPGEPGRNFNSRHVTYRRSTLRSRFARPSRTFPASCTARLQRTATAGWRIHLRAPTGPERGQRLSCAFLL